jgi:hypothetical protein
VSALYSRSFAGSSRRRRSRTARRGTAGPSQRNADGGHGGAGNRELVEPIFGDHPPSHRDAHLVQFVRGVLKLLDLGRREGVVGRLVPVRLVCSV